MTGEGEGRGMQESPAGEGEVRDAGSPVVHYLLAAAVVTFLFLLAVAAGFAPSRLWITNGAFLVANYFVVYVGMRVYREDTAPRLFLFFGGYAAVILLFMALERSMELALLALLGYAACFRCTRLLGYYIIFCLSVLFFRSYGLHVFVYAAVVYAVVLNARRRGVPRMFLVFLGAGAGFLAFILFPVGVLVRGTVDAGAVNIMWTTLKDPEVRAALRNSFASATAAVCIAAFFGVMLGYVLGRTSFRGRAFIAAVTDIPVMIPQPVIGMAFLMLFSRAGPVGGYLWDRWGVLLEGFPSLVMIQVFVSFPFVVKAAAAAFEMIDPDLEKAARTLGASPLAAFFRVALPLASRGIFFGVVIGWSRAVSELGALLLAAPAPVTAAVLVHNRLAGGLAGGGPEAARPVAMLMVVSCVSVFVGFQFLRSLLPAGKLSRREGP